MLGHEISCKLNSRTVDKPIIRIPGLKGEINLSPMYLELRQ